MYVMNTTELSESSSDVDAFEEYRRLLFAIAYRMVGTAMEAEDIVQETYLRYRSARHAQIDNLKAYLTTITTRLCLDYLKSAQTQRQSYFGIWLPEPVAGDEALAAEPVDPAPTPAEIITQEESISMAFLVILEQLMPVERAVLVLRGVFDYDYPEIAAMVGKSEANCRQIFRRAQAQVRAQRPRFDVSPEAHATLVNRFMAAVQGGDFDAMLQMLTNDVTFVSDGGGKASAALYPLTGPDKVMRFLAGLAAKGGHLVTIATAPINGRLGVLLYNLDGGLETVFIFDVVPDAADSTGGARIGHIYAMRNPDKLARLGKAISD
jgi:RNA polymerase sigma-70 factor, ECF subfamily